jgi:hypothetical protein
MHPGMYGNYLSAPPTGSVVIGSDGVQMVTEETRARITGFLETLYPGVPQGQSPAVGVTLYQARPCAEIQASGQLCSVSALDYFRTQPAVIYMVNVTSASPTFVEVAATNDPAAVPFVANAGTDFAVISYAPVGKKEEKKKPEATTLVLGAAAGGALGLAVGGPAGAVVGAVGGGALANWLA